MEQQAEEQELDEQEEQQKNTETVEEQSSDVEQQIDQEKLQPPDAKGNPKEVLEEIYNEMEMQDDYYELDVIVDYWFKDVTLILNACYHSDSTDNREVLETPFSVIKKDLHVEVAKYITNHVVDSSRRTGFYSSWARKTLKQASRSIRRLKTLYNMQKEY
eukprot:4778956-Ditylum_brightwellii.AAC.1